MLKGLPKGYAKNIHFIGHSLGTLVSTYAAKYAKKHNLFFAHLMSHIVYLDSPCWGVGNVPGGKFLHDNKGTIFFENYVSSVVGMPYIDADVNVALIKAQEWPSIETHSYSYYWYMSSVRNFEDRILESSIPTSTMPWGFYWWTQGNRSGIKPFYSQRSTGHHYYLAEGFPTEVRGWWTMDAGMIIDIVKAYIDASVDILSQLASYAEWTGQKVTIIGANTYNTLANTAGYVTDVAGHAMWEALGFITLNTRPQRCCPCRSISRPAQTP